MMDWERLADVTLLDEIEIVLVLQFDFYYPYA